MLCLELVTPVSAFPSFVNRTQHTQAVFCSYILSGAATLQVDTPIKKLLVAVGVGYLALVLLVPTLNVFYQVRPAKPFTPQAYGLASSTCIHCICVCMRFGSVYLVLHRTCRVCCFTGLDCPAVGSLHNCRAAAVQLHSDMWLKAFAKTSVRMLQAFGKGIGPFIENVTEPDFLQAVSWHPLSF